MLRWFPNTQLLLQASHAALPILNSSKLPLALGPRNYLTFKLYQLSVINYGTKFCRLCLKLLLPTILTSSLAFYPYQKDERALPGYLLTRSSFFPLRYKAPLAFPQMFSLYFYSYTILSDSLSLFGFKCIITPNADCELVCHQL
jgi:hypothetical protein